MGRAAGIMLALCAIAAACTSDGSAAPDTSAIEDTPVSEDATTDLTTAAADNSADSNGTDGETVDAAPPDEVEPAPIDTASRLSGGGSLAVSVYAPAEIVDELGVSIVGSQGDIAPTSCETQSDHALFPASIHYSCDEVLPGSYDVSIDHDAIVDGRTTVGVVCSNEQGTDETTAEVYASGHAWCEVYAVPPTLRLSAHSVSGPDWSPMILDADGAPFDDGCERTIDLDGYAQVICTGIPDGDYRLPAQPFEAGSPDAPFRCYAAYGDDTVDGVVTIETGVNERGGPLNFWECYQDVTEDMLPGRIELIAWGSPSAARALDPIVLQGGVDVFDTHCDVAEDYEVWRSGLLIVCDELDRELIDIVIPEVDGARIELRCDPAIAYPSHREVTVDLTGSSTGWCSAARIEPTLAIAMLSPDARPDWDIDEFVIELPAGSVGIGWCDQVEVVEPGIAELWVYCSPVRDTTIVVPDQPVVAGLPDARFVCEAGFGIASGPGLDNSAQIAVINDDGFVPDVWTCHNHDNW